MTKITLQNCLATTHPEIAVQWHPTKNGDLTINDVTVGSGKKVWWKCPIAEDHEWESTIVNRTGKKSGCPCCLGLKVVPSNCLIMTHPEIAAQWHPTKNGNLTPNDVTVGSGKKVWWKCNVADDHEWEVSINKRQKYGCPCCCGNKVVPSNCLATTHPEIAVQWHPTKNGDLTPNDISFGSIIKVLWKCPVADDHEWETSVNSRTSNKHGCPCCCGNKVVPSNCLATTHPEIAAQWHPTKNGDLTPRYITAGSTRMVWWKCPVADDHEWKASVVDRKKYGCPCCCGRKVVPSNCLATTHPEIAKQWHPTKNGNLTPNDVGFGSNKKVWWKCPVAEDHEWKASVDKRQKCGCPCCCGNKVVPSNCLATTHPEIAVQWHPTKNGNLTPRDITAGSTRKVWWKCPVTDDHEWKVSIKCRKKCGCPICNASKGEAAIAAELNRKQLLFKREWQFKTCKNKFALPFDFVVKTNNGIKIIEYQGEQHYRLVTFGASEEKAQKNFADCQKRDEIKREWCRSRGYQLLEIPYWDFDRIPEILEEFLQT